VVYLIFICEMMQSLGW